MRIAIVILFMFSFFESKSINNIGLRYFEAAFFYTPNEADKNKVHLEYMAKNLKDLKKEKKIIRKITTYDHLGRYEKITINNDKGQTYSNQTTLYDKNLLKVLKIDFPKIDNYVIKYEVFYASDSSCYVVERIENFIPDTIRYVFNSNKQILKRDKELFTYNKEGLLEKIVSKSGLEFEKRIYDVKSRMIYHKKSEERFSVFDYTDSTSVENEYKIQNKDTLLFSKKTNYFDKNSTTVKVEFFLASSGKQTLTLYHYAKDRTTRVYYKSKNKRRVDFVEEEVFYESSTTF